MDVIRPHQSVQGRMNLKGNYGADIKIEVSKSKKYFFDEKKSKK